MDKKRMIGNGLLMLTAFIWGTSFVSQALGMESIEPFTFNCVRNIIAGLFLIPCIKFLNKISPEKKPPMTAKEKKYLLRGGIACGAALFVASTLQQFGILYTTVGKAGFITALYVIIVPILGLFMKRKVPAKIWGCMVFAVIGLYLLCINETFTLNIGDILVLACAFAFAVHILVIDHYSPNTDGVKMSCIQFFLCGIFSIAPALLFEKVVFQDIIDGIWPLLYSAILSSGVAYTLQIVAQKDTDPVIASLILCLESVFSVLAGWVVLHQSLSAKELFGCALMFTAIVISQLPDRKKKA